MDTYFGQAFADLGEEVDRDDLVELCVNPDGAIWTEYRGDHQMAPTGRRMAADQARILGESIAGRAKVTIGPDDPLVSAAFEHRGRLVRAQVVMPPASLGGVALALRFFSAAPVAGIALDWLDGRRDRSLDAERRAEGRHLRALVSAGALEDVFSFIVEQRLNTVIAGGTSTGKTVALRHLMTLVGPMERVITIEDAAELTPMQPNRVSLIADRTSTVRSPDALLIATLRMRPDRLVVGEVRGKEAMTFLEAINTGNGGSMTTLHAETPELAIDRLAMAAGRSDVPMTYQDLRAYIRRSIDVIVQTGRIGGRRGVAQIYLPTETEP